ncbi:MAG: hypothetical protein IT323_01050 [Anaerolineae bacterium]|nr:hypothetical protein [Anaerolineae bacterium]
MEDPRDNTPPVSGQDAPPPTTPDEQPFAPEALASDEARAVPTTDSADATTPSASHVTAPRPFETLTLGEALASLARHPRAAWDALWRTIDADAAGKQAPVLAPADAPAGIDAQAAGSAAFTARPAHVGAAVRVNRLLTGLRGAGVLAQLALIVLVALLGAMFSDDVTARQVRSAPVTIWLLIVAAVLMLVFTLRNVTFPRLEPFKRREAAAGPFLGFDALLARHGLRFALGGAAGLLSFGAWVLNASNRFTVEGVVSWFASIALWVIVFAGSLDQIGEWLRRVPGRVVALARRPFTLRLSWPLVAMLVILAVAAWFRFSDLASAPPEMTSDHVEKLLDARLVSQGITPVFFPNNGGRESFMMYYLALLSRLTGLGFDHTLLKIGTGLIGMLVVALAFWMGRSVFGEEDHRLGTLTGLAMAALIATSYWHTMLSRLGLRIVLTTLAVIVIFTFLARAMRHNRRRDFLAAGLMLGLSMYFYQAMRMFPLVVIVGAFVTVALRARSWRVLGQYMFNFAALVVVALAVFVPLGRYWSQYPDSFWERTGGRFFGEDTVVVRDDQGRILEERAVTPEERQAAFQKNLGVFVDNYRRSLLMFNVDGDRAFITGEPSGTPELDAVAGAFLWIGLGVIAARIARRRDPVDWLMPLAILIMLLPTALSIAFPIEVPSATRASGTLPFVYLIAALGLALVVQAFSEMARRRWLRDAVIAAVVVLLTLGAASNAYSYFDNAMRSYRAAVFPYKQAGNLITGFAESTGAPGNAFMIGWDMWWDYRILGVNAGYPNWPNGVWYDRLIERITDQMDANAGTQYALRPDRQMLFILHRNAEAPLATLQAAFPGGDVLDIEAFSPDHNFRVYVSPPLGCAWVRERLQSLPEACLPPLEDEPVVPDVSGAEG